MERRGDDAVDALGPDVGVRARAVDEVRVGDVVGADVGLAGDDGLAGRADLEPVVGVLGPLGLEDLLLARRHQAAEQPRVGVDDVDARAVAVEQAEGLVDRELDDRLGIAGAGDPGAELAQAPFDDGLPLPGLAGPIELGDQPGVGHRERRVLRERADQRDLGRGEGVGAARERAQRAEHLRPGDERRDHERAQADLVDEAVRPCRVAERRVVVVVLGDDHPALGDGLAEHPGADRQPQLADPVAGFRVGDARGVGEVEDVRVGVEQVEERAVGVEQAGGLLGGVLEQPILVAAGPDRERRRLGGGAVRRVGPGAVRRLGRGAVRAGLDLRGWTWGGTWWPRPDESKRRSRVRACVICPGPGSPDDEVTRRRSWSSAGHRRRACRAAGPRTLTASSSRNHRRRTRSETSNPRPSTRRSITRERLDQERPHRRRRRTPLRHRRPDPGHRVHPQHPRRPAVHHERRPATPSPPSR